MTKKKYQKQRVGYIAILAIRNRESINNNGKTLNSKIENREYQNIENREQGKQTKLLTTNDKSPF